MSRAVVLGATGEMGARVMRLLERALPAAELVGAARGSGGTRPGAAMVRADVGDSQSLREALRGARVVVNAVGPYDWDPRPLLEACTSCGCDYVDLAETPSFLDAVSRAAREVGALEAGITVTPGASTVPGLVELLAALLEAGPGLEAASSFQAWLSLGSANPVSPGLLAGLLSPLGRRRSDEGRYFERTHPFTVGGRTLRFGRFPDPWPRGLGARGVPSALYVGFDRAWLTRLLVVAGRILSQVPEARIPGLARWLAPVAGVARFLGSPEGALAVVALGGDGHERGRVEVAASRAGLDVPALPAVWAAMASLLDAPRPSGVVRLPELVPPETARTRLEEAGYPVQIHVPAR